MNNPNEKYEIIEQALQESVGGGAPVGLCHISCHILSINVCDVDICHIPFTVKAQ